MQHVFEKNVFPASKCDELAMEPPLFDHNDDDLLNFLSNDVLLIPKPITYKTEQDRDLRMRQYREKHPLSKNHATRHKPLVVEAPSVVDPRKHEAPRPTPSWDFTPPSPTDIEMIQCLPNTYALFQCPKLRDELIVNGTVAITLTKHLLKGLPQDIGEHYNAITDGGKIDPSLTNAGVLTKLLGHLVETTDHIVGYSYGVEGGSLSLTKAYFNLSLLLAPENIHDTNSSVSVIIPLSPGTEYTNITGHDNDDLFAFTGMYDAIIVYPGCKRTLNPNDNKQISFVACYRFNSHNK